MRRLAVPAVAVLCASGAGLVAQDDAARLRFEPQKDFAIVLPAETWAVVVSGIPIRHHGGSSFAAEMDGVALMVDTDGDDRLDTKIQGATGYAVLKGRRDDESRFGYAVRLRKSGETYEYSTSCVMSGSLQGVSVDLIDQNGDGVFNEFGVDAMVVGGGKLASLLSEVVELKGQLYRIEVDADGTSMRAEPFDGPTGTLRVRGGLRLPGKLVSAVVTDDSGRYSFQVADANEVRVPVGAYKLSGGFAKAGGDTARVRAGDMAPLVVTDGGTAEFASWGAPLVAEFDFTREGELVVVQPSVRFIGRGGEEWHTLLPDSKSPRLEFIDADRDKVLQTKRFEGC